MKKLPAGCGYKLTINPKDGKNAFSGMPQKGQEQVTDIQRNVLTSVIHFVVYLYNVN